jgi:hypothetical protein
MYRDISKREYYAALAPSSREGRENPVTTGIDTLDIAGT